MSQSTFFGLLFITMGSTLLGSGPVLFHRYLKEHHWRWSESFCGGVMLSASVFSLYLPAYEIVVEENSSFMPLIWGTLWGVFFIVFAHFIMHRLVPNHVQSRAFLFVLAMGIHNVPEGMAVGVDVAALGWERAMPLGIAIFIQNLPEGLVSSMTFLVGGFTLKNSLMANGVTAVIEGLSALFGYSFVLKAGLGLSFLLAFSGACMSSVVLLEVWSKFRAEGVAKFSWSGLLIGLTVCGVLDLFL